MTSTEQLPEIAATTETRAVESRRPYRTYFGWLAVLPVLLYLSAFPLVQVRSYEQWGATQWGPVLEYGFDPRPQNADIVVFGDSSAFLGVDPRLLNARLGVKTVVIPSVASSLPVMGDAPLRSYLAHNAKPKTIVLYFAPWNLDYATDTRRRMFEGEEMMLRHGSRRELLAFGLRHPVETLAFPLRLYSTFGVTMFRRMIRGESREQATAEAFGHFDYPEKVAALTRDCIYPNTITSRRGSLSVERLRQKYESQGMQVLLYFAPVPACSDGLAAMQQTFRQGVQLGADLPAVLPAPMFADDQDYVHVRPEYVARVSGLLADSLAVRLPDEVRRTPTLGK